MADAQTQDDDPRRFGDFRLDPEAHADWQRSVNADIGSLVGMPDKQSIDKLTSGMHLEQYIQAAKTDALSREFDVNVARDKAYRERAFQLEGVAANELPRPWNAEEEHKRFETNPIEGFGSVGGLFAVIASAFTKAPMENAINGLAGAINGTREGNEAGYNRAFDAFKTNVHLADQRFKMQHELYEDALSLGSADMAASQAKFHNAAIRFGDRQALMLMENGLYPQLYELLDARAKAHEQMIKSADAIDLHTVQKAAVDSLKMNPPQTGDEVQDKMMLARQVQLIFDPGKNAGIAQQQAVIRYMGDPNNLKKSSQEFIDGLAKINEQFSRTADIDRLRADYIAEKEQGYRDTHDGQDPPAEERAKFIQEALSLNRGSRAAGGSPMVQEQAAYIEKAKAEIRQKEGRDTTADEDRLIIKQAKEKFGDRKIDQAIINELKDNYPGMKEDDLGFIPITQQPRLKGAFESADRLEAIAAYAKENPDAIGLVADSARRMNLDAYQGLFNDLPKLKNATEKDSDAAIDAAAKEKGLNLSTAAKAKVLQKMLTTQAFADAAQAGSRGATIYLDKAFREIYDQASSPSAFFSILEKRYDDANRETSAYRMPFDERAQHKDMPFWQQKAAGFVTDLGSAPKKAGSDKPPVPGARKAPDGNWYVNDPNRPGKYLRVDVK